MSDFEKMAEEFKRMVRLQYIDHRCKSCGQVASIKINESYYAEDAVEDALHRVDEAARKEDAKIAHYYQHAVSKELFENKGFDKDRYVCVVGKLIAKKILEKAKEENGEENEMGTVHDGNDLNAIFCWHCGRRFRGNHFIEVDVKGFPVRVHKHCKDFPEEYANRDFEKNGGKDRDE